MTTQQLVERSHPPFQFRGLSWLLSVFISALAVLVGADAHAAPFSNLDFSAAGENTPGGAITNATATRDKWLLTFASSSTNFFINSTLDVAQLRGAQTGRARALLQLTNDGGSTKGKYDLTFDLNHDETGSDTDLLFHFIGWNNTAVTEPVLSMGGNVSYDTLLTANDAVGLLPSSATTVTLIDDGDVNLSGSGPNYAASFEVDFGAGFDHLAIMFAARTQRTSPFVNIDNIVFTKQQVENVPEPTSVAMLSFGILGIGLVIRRRLVK